MRGLRDAQQAQQGGCDIDLTSRSVHQPLMREQARIDDEQRNLQLFIVYRESVYGLTMFAERLAMIAGNHQQGIVGESHFFKLVGELSDQSVHRLHPVQVSVERGIAHAVVPVARDDIGVMGIHGPEREEERLRLMRIDPVDGRRQQRPVLRQPGVAMLRGDHSETMIEQELGTAVLSDRARVEKSRGVAVLSEERRQPYRRQIRSPARNRKPCQPWIQASRKARSLPRRCCPAPHRHDRTARYEPRGARAAECLCTARHRGQGRASRRIPSRPSPR